MTREGVVTNGHVVDGAASIRVRRGIQSWAATLAHSDPKRDLCQLRVPGLGAPSVSIRPSANLRTGERVYAIGAPQGLELTLSEGLISSLRPYEGVQLIQTTAPISAGSSGGGLFDTSGRLIGITTSYVKEGQNLNFALPGEWIAALPTHPARPPVMEGRVKAQDESSLWVLAGLAAAGAKDWTKAVSAFREALRLKPDDFWAWQYLGESYDEQGQSAQAITAYREAIRLKPDFVPAWLNLGVAYANQGRLAEAITASQEAIRLKPDDELAWKNLGLWYTARGEVSQAISALREAIRLKPDDAGSWFGLGLAYALRGDRGKVMEIYKQLKILDPAKAEEFFREVVRP